MVLVVLGNKMSLVACSAGCLRNLATVCPILKKCGVPGKLTKLDVCLINLCLE